VRRHARSLEDCLKADAGIARLSTHAWRLSRLQRIFEAATPLARQSRVANIKLGKIVIYAASSAVGAKLRQMEPRLTKVFRSEAAEVTGIEIRVQPANVNPKPPAPPTPVEIGDQAKQVLTSLADGLPEGSALAAALRRLVRRAR
jgi:hypothetical protein